MATTYTLIDKAILSSNQSSVSFTGLGAYSSNYTDLQLVYSCRGDNADAIRGFYMTLNGSTSNFTGKYLRGYSTGADSGSIARYLGEANAAGSTSDTFTSAQIYFPNYSSSNYKSFSVDWATEANSGSGFSATLGFVAGLWSDTSAITSIGLAFDAGNIVSGSSFYLYGIKNS